jgi:hypothetical protein
MALFSPAKVAPFAGVSKQADRPGLLKNGSRHFQPMN